MTDTTLPPAAARAPAANQKPSQKFYMAVWRWHFYAGFFTFPIILALAITGMLMVYANVFDDRYGVDRAIEAGHAPLPVIEQAKAAQAVMPDGQVTLYVTPSRPDQASQFMVSGASGDLLVSVNPYTGAIVDQGVKDDSLYVFANDIHGSLLMGQVGDWLLEIAAGMGVILVITGVFLWWPREGRGVLRALVPNLRLKGRRLWKELHLSIGIWFSLILVIFLLTGMAWTSVWGGQFVQAWSTFPAEKWDNVPLSDQTHASLNHAPLKEVPWGLEQTPLPASGSDAGTPGVPSGHPVNLNTVAALAQSLGFAPQFRINLPAGPEGVYTISMDSMDGDNPDPMTDRTVHVDRHTGKVLADVGFDNYSAGAKTMAVGIAFHMGDMGLWNAILNIIFCAAIIFMVVTGIVMWWLRRPAKAFGLVAPPMPERMPLWKGAVFIMLCLSLAFPLVGLTLLAVLALDLLVLSRLPALARVFA